MEIFGKIFITLFIEIEYKQGLKQSYKHYIYPQYQITLIINHEGQRRHSGSLVICPETIASRKLKDYVFHKFPHNSTHTALRITLSQTPRGTSIKPRSLGEPYFSLSLRAPYQI